MLTKLLAVFVLATSLSAQTAPAPVFSKVASEGADQGSSPVVTLTAGMTYRFGFGAKWCDAVTVTSAINITVWFQTVTCTVTVAGVTTPTSDVFPGQVKELDIQQQATGQVVLMFTAGVSTSVPVPALPPPPPPPPPPTPTYATTCSTTLDPKTGIISIMLNATPSN